MSEPDFERGFLAGWIAAMHFRLPEPEACEICGIQHAEPGYICPRSGCPKMRFRFGAGEG